ncbi:MAG: PAS domain S-box protein [Nitrospirota bacterium]
MKNENKTKKQLINELNTLLQRVVELETSFKEFKKTAEAVNKESDSLSMELAICLSEVFEALKKISSGDPDVRIPEESEIELISKLKCIVNMTAKNIGEIVDQSHEFAMVLSEHFDVLHRVSKGELGARVYGESKSELLEALKKVTNEMIETIDREIAVRKRMENELRESEERYRRLFETSKDGILLLDRQTGNIININPAIVELFGDFGEFVGKNLKDIGLFKDIEDAQEVIHKLDEVGFIFYDCVPVETREGQFIDTEIYLIDRAKVIQCNIRNITERKRAEKSIAALCRQNEMILNAAGEGILGLDTEGKHTFVNPSAAKMFGYEVEELTGQPSHKIWHHTKKDGSPYPETECPVYAALKDGLTHRLSDEVFWRKDGSSFPVSYVSTPIVENGGLVGAVVTFRDITEHKQAEKEIKKRVKELQEFYDMAVSREIRMKELKETIKEMKEEIERLKEELERYKKHGD